MKKILSILLVGVLLMLPKGAMAAPSGSLSCSSTSTTVGNTVTITVSGSVNEEVMWDITAYSGDESKLKIISDSRYISDGFSSSISKSYKFKAVDNGNVTVSANAAISGYSGVKSNISASCTVKIGAKVEEKPKSADNALKSLKIGEIKLTPEFNSDVLEYSGEIQSDDKVKINIEADARDNKSKIDGIGEREIDLGSNKIEIVVTAENGATRTYVITLTVNEKNPIVVKVEGKKYKVSRKINDIKVPEGYEKTTIKIKGKEVEAFKNNSYTLVVLLDEQNRPALFIYKKGRYTRYSEFTNSNLRLLLIVPDKKEIPYKYKKCEFKVNNEIVEGYELSPESKFKLVYAINLDTGEKDFYLYDLDQKTFQRFYNDQVNIYIKLIKKTKIGLVVLAGLFAILFITIICLVSTNFKTKRKITKITDVKK